jgi:hypothetical protein
VTAKPEQIVIDKDVFITYMKCRFDELCDFSKQHILLLSDTLLYECATATKQNPAALVRKCECLIKEGARYCSMSVHFIQWEAWRCIPYPEALTNAEPTDRIRHGDMSINNILASEPSYLHGLHMRWADTILAKFSADLKSELDSRVEDVGSQIKKLPSARPERLVEWLGRIDRMDVHTMAVESFPAGWIRVKGEFCLSPAWMTWQHLRLVMVLVYEYWYIRQTGSPRDKYAEHDLQDTEYVLLLSRADGIITKDQGLTELARAAFPDKRVFSSLESYRCDGTDA